MSRRDDILLDVRDLHVHVHTADGVLRAVDGATFSVARGEALGIVGESGSGKSMTCQAVLQVQPRPAAVIEHGQIIFDQNDLLQKSEREMRRVRGARIGMILQDPLNSLSPVTTIGNQLIESLRLSAPNADKGDLEEQAVQLLERVGINAARQRLYSFPFEFSGGMRQRVAAAIGISREPELLIADEPTTALDVTTQRRFLNLLVDLKRERNMSLILVTHDFGVVAQVCDRVAVMYGGRVVEIGALADVLNAPRHPYTRALLNAIPDLHGPPIERLYQIEGEPPDNRSAAVGCRFAPRCEFADQRCHQQYPPTVRYSDGASVACWRSVPDDTGGANEL